LYFGHGGSVRFGVCFCLFFNALLRFWCVGDLFWFFTQLLKKMTENRGANLVRKISLMFFNIMNLKGFYSFCGCVMNTA